MAAGGLRACDVLLYEGHGWVSEAIRFVDGTPYSHASLHLGDGTVAEAVGQGVLRRSLAASAGGVEVLVRRLKQDVPTLDPVRERALALVADGGRYAYEQIVLLALLCLTRKLKLAPALAALVRTVLDRAAGVVAGWTAAGRQPLICSELVYRCYDEALPEAADIYRLEIGPGPPPRGAPRAMAMAAGVRPAVHPDSLLAWRLSNPSPAAETAVPRATRSRAGAGSAPEDDLEALIRRYLTEARDAAPVARAAPPLPAGLAGAIDRFAMAWVPPPPPRVRGVTGALAGEVAVRALTAVAADFVTPGDLLKTESLFNVGGLDLSRP